MFISRVDEGLEKLVRSRLPLAEEHGDVSFETPTKTWAAQVSRITVNLFLYGVKRSPQPARPAVRAAADGRPAMARKPQPMIQLTYLVSAWAGSPRDEHQLLGDLVSLLSGTETIPADLLSDELSSGVQIALGDEEMTVLEAWGGTGSDLKPAVQVRATVAADTFDWELLAPPVTRIAAMADRMDRLDRSDRATRA